MARVRVLVADDNQAMRDILTSILTAEFDVIRAVGDGGAALVAATQLFQTSRFLMFACQF